MMPRLFLLVTIITFALAAVPALGAEINCRKFRHSRRVHVKNTKQLDNAIRKASPGTLIMMAPGKYSSTIYGGNYRNLRFNNKRGTKSQPITLCGPRSAIIDSGGVRNPVVMKIIKSSYINIAGITLQNGLKGLVIDQSSHCRVVGILARNFGGEAMHIQGASSYYIIMKSRITDTGKVRPGIGEGIYVGSDDSRGIDKCTNNHILFNNIGPRVTAEMIDIKQNSKGGVIRGNKMDGRDLCNCNSATSVLNVKGNGYKIISNVGRNAKEDVFKVATTQRGQGKGNYFARNKCVGGLRSGFYCVKVPETSSLPNRVSCGQRSNKRCLG